MNFIIFDIDGTLTNTKAVDDKCFIKAFQETFKLDITNENWEAIKHVTDWGITQEIVIRELGRKPTQFEYESMMTNLIKNLEEEQSKDLSQFAEVDGAGDFFSKLMQIEDIGLGVSDRRMGTICTTKIKFHRT